MHRSLVARRSHHSFAERTVLAPNLLAIVVAGAMLVVASGRGGQASAAPPDWLVGDALHRELDADFLATWSGVPLRTLLGGVAKQRRVAIWLDRRVDPGRPIDFSPRDLTLKETLARLAERTNCHASVVGSVVYFAPVRAGEKLATLAAVKRAEVQRLPRPRAAKLLAERAWSWPERAEPRQLVQDLLDEAGLVARNLDEAVPHDLWPALDLPPLAWADRLTLALAGFGATFELSSDGREIAFLPWPDRIEYEHAYTFKGDAAKALEQLRSRYPKSELRAATGRIHVKGPYEDHEEIARALRGEKVVRTTKVGAGDKSYTMTIERQPFGPVAKTLGERLGFEIEVAPALEPMLDRPVTLSVESVSANELWNALGKAAGVAVRVDGRKVVFSPSAP